jgi:hypothetical protein
VRSLSKGGGGSRGVEGGHLSLVSWMGKGNCWRYGEGIYME